MVVIFSNLFGGSLLTVRYLIYGFMALTHCIVPTSKWCQPLALFGFRELGFPAVILPVNGYGKEQKIVRLQLHHFGYLNTRILFSVFC